MRASQSPVGMWNEGYGIQFLEVMRITLPALRSRQQQPPPQQLIRNRQKVNSSIAFQTCCCDKDMTSMANTYSYPILFHRGYWVLSSLLVLVLLVGVAAAAPSNGDNTDVQTFDVTGGGEKITSYTSNAMQSYQWSDGIYSRGNLLSNGVLQQQQQGRNLQRNSDGESSAKTAMQQCHSYLQEEILSEEPGDILGGNNNEEEEVEDEFECGYCQTAMDDRISFIQRGYPNCQYCNEDETICGLDTLQMTFTSTSSTSSTINTANIVPNYLKFQYIRGRKEEIVLYYPNDGTCYVEIDGIKCRYCGAAVDCPKRASSSGNGNDFKLDCTNLSVLYDDDDNLTYECGVGHAVFQFLYDPNFLSCVDYDETQTPRTSAPNKSSNTKVDDENNDGGGADKGDSIELDDPQKNSRSISRDTRSTKISTAITTTASAMIIVVSLFTYY